MSPSASSEPTSLVERRGISHLLLDIEGTTCPVDFVAGTLFPYARERLGNFLRSRGEEPAVRALVKEVEAAWRVDPDPKAKALRLDPAAAAMSSQPEGVLPYLQWLIREDRKLTALKELQGLVWADGYASGELTAPLFSDVPEALRSWYRQGWILAVYSSGSVAAQQLLYGFSNAGDLRTLFDHWFDTRIGGKQSGDSYTTIANSMAVHPASVLFVSDAVAELEAAASAGMQVIFSDREGNPQRDPGPYPWISSFSQLRLIR
jgi:enolase-phosphatase E1